MNIPPPPPISVLAPALDMKEVCILSLYRYANRQMTIYIFLVEFLFSFKIFNFIRYANCTTYNITITSQHIITLQKSPLLWNVIKHDSEKLDSY